MHKTKGHTFDTLVVYGLDVFRVVFNRMQGFVLFVDQCGERRTIDIRVEYPYSMSCLLQRRSQIDSNSTLPNPTLTTTHSYDLLNLRQIELFLKLLRILFGC